MPRSVQEHSSGPPGPESNPTIAQAVSSFLAGLSQEDRAACAQELNAFARWFGVQRALRSLIPPDLERYQEQLAAESRTDITRRLEALRTFLFDAKRQGWIETNLAVEIKLKNKKKKTGSQPAKATSPREPVGNGVRLTPEGHEKLTKELEYLETEMRPQIALELRTAAADKDFRENAPYDVAKHHQGEVEARIRDLQNLLQTGEVVATTHSHVIIDLGSKVRLRDLGEDEEIVYTLVGPGEIDPRQGRISIQSPVGRALAGKVVGDEVEVEVPAGKLRLRIEGIEGR